MNAESKKKKALICGVSGQDGSYLARLLLKKGYEVYGTSRDAQVCPFTNLVQLGIRDKVKTLPMAVNDFRSVFHVLNRIYEARKKEWLDEHLYLSQLVDELTSRV